MKIIVTLTMNPSLDFATEVETLEPEKKLRCTAPREDPGGGGINVARALRRLGGEVTALYTCGGPAGQRLRELLDEQEVPQLVVPIRGATRQDLLVQETTSGRNYRFVLPGPELGEDEWQGCLDRLAELQPRPAYLVASGSLPPGVPIDFYARVARLARQHGMRVILDTSGEPLAAALEEGVFLLRENHNEFAELAGAEPEDVEALRTFAEKTVSEKNAEVVIVTLGAEGALLVGRNEYQRFRPPEVEIESPHGAGDSFVAALVYRFAGGGSMAEALRYGVAGAAAALLRPGTGRLRPEDLKELYRRVRPG